MLMFSSPPGPIECLDPAHPLQIKVEEGIVQREIHARMEQETAKPRHLARSLSYVQRAVDATRSNDMEVSPFAIQT